MSATPKTLTTPTAADSVLLADRLFSETGSGNGYVARFDPLTGQLQGRAAPEEARAWLHQPNPHAGSGNATLLWLALRHRELGYQLIGWHSLLPPAQQPDWID